MGVTEHAPREATTAPLISRGINSIVEEQQALILLLHEYWSLAVRDEKLREGFVERQGALRDALARALEARHETTGVPLTMPARTLATGIIAMATGLAQARMADPEGVSEDLLGELLSLFYDGLVHRAEGTR
jgi:hypothetical protein